MTFEYGPYLRECFSQPIIALLWTLPFILLFLIPALLALHGARKSPERRAAGRLVLIVICILVIVGFPLGKQIGTLAQTNGIAILLDRDAEPLTMTGTIEAIRMPERNADTRFHYDGKSYYGAWLTIGGTEYYAVSAGNLDVGDAVIIEYMPKSRCVLYLAAADPTQEE